MRPKIVVRVVIKIGRRRTLPASRIVDSSAEIRESFLRVKDAVVHTHGPTGEHSHGEIAFTTWLDPMLAIEQADCARSITGCCPLWYT